MIKREFQLNHIHQKKAKELEQEIKKLQGIQQTHIDSKHQILLVEAKSEASLQAVVDTLKQFGCTDATHTDSMKTAHPHEHVHHHEHHHDHCECEHEGAHHHEHHHDHCECGHEGLHHHEHHHDHCACEHDAQAKEERKIKGAVKFRISNLDCANCAQKVEAAIKAAEHIEDAALNFSSSLLFVKTDRKEDEEQLRQRLQTIADDAEPGVVIKAYSAYSAKDESISTSQKKEMIRLACALLLFIIGEVLQEEYFFAGAILISGAPVVYKALRNLLQGEWFDENFLMSIAAFGAFAIGEWAEGCAVMVFYEIGELFQSYAVNRSRRSISDLMDIKAEYANVIVDGKEVRVQPDEVHIGDIIQIRPGERVPLDGTVIQGTSSLDTSALSGESLPRDVAAGDEILAGTVNLNSLIQVKVEKEFAQSSVSRILELVENAGSKKAPMEKFITKFARIYTPAVVGGALLLLIVPMLIIEDALFYDWLYRALTFLVVSCPCALVVSIPLGLFAGIGGAGRKGILVKGGNYLEALADIDTVVFDKTGTLTKGSFQVTSVYARNGDEQALLELGAYGEAYSNHPIAQSIVNAYAHSIDQSRISDFEEITGSGIQCKIDRERVYLGNAKLMDRIAAAYDKETPIGTIIHIAKEQEYLGYIVINDEIKETSAEAIRALRKEGVKQCIMLSGDRDEVAQSVGRSLQLDRVYAQLLPHQKVEKVEELLTENQGKLAFVGDGINDAPVLARADIGVAMGGIGSDAAIEAADLVLMKDDPLSLAEAIRISKRTKRILWQNVIFSLSVKAAVLLLTIFGLSTMWMGVFADVGVTLLAVINSMRALKA